MLTVGEGSSPSIAGSVRCMDKYQMPYELVSQENHQIKYPMLKFPKHYTYMVDTSAGVLHADKALLAYQVWLDITFTVNQTLVGARGV